MYLFVFVFLVMSVVGLYTQVYALQMSKMYEKQTGAAQIMLTWHEGMRKYVKDHHSDFSADNKVKNSGCVLTTYVDWPNNNHPVPGGRLCDAALLLKTKTDDLTSDNDIVKRLPGYNFNSYRFRSMAYKPGDCTECAFAKSLVVITYIPKGGTVAGFNVNQVARQLQNLEVGPMYIGFVNGSEQIVTNNGLIVKVPTDNYKPNEGALVLIEQIPSQEEELY